MPNNRTAPSNNKPNTRKSNSRGSNKPIKASKFRKKAIGELALRQWAKATESLNDAVKSDPTDENNQLLLSQVQSLLKARSLLTQLKTGVREAKHKIVVTGEVQEIINKTSGSPELSVLWQEIVRKFGEYNTKKNRPDRIIRIIVWSVIGAVFPLIIFLSFIYLLPRSHPVINCSKTKGLEVALNYPDYIANGDKGSVILTIKNTGKEVIDGEVLLEFQGTSKVQFESKHTNKVTIREFGHAEQKSVEIDFSLNEPFRNYLKRYSEPTCETRA